MAPNFNPSSRLQAEHLYDKAVDHLAEGNSQAAIEGFRASLAADYEFRDAAHGLITALKGAGYYDDAITVAQQLAEDDPDDVLAHTSLSILYQHQGRIAEAETESMRAKLLGWKQQLHQQKDTEGRP